MAKMSLEYHGGVFRPATKAAQLEALRFKPGQRLLGDISGKRNIKFHRLYWAFCTYVAEALNSGPGDLEWTQEILSDRLKLATGRAEQVALPPSLQRHYGTSVALKPASISFAKMGEEEFGAFVEAAMAYIITEFGPWIQDHPDWEHVREIAHQSRVSGAAA